MATPQFTITVDGDYPLDTSFKPNKTVIYASGTMGAATVVVTYKNEAGTYFTAKQCQTLQPANSTK